MVQVVILAAGQSKRMQSSLSKVMHPLCGQRVVDYVIDTARTLRPHKIVVVTSPDCLEQPWPDDVIVTVQNPPRGTGDAVMQTLPHLHKGSGRVLVMFGDTPLITSETLAKVTAIDTSTVTILGMRPDNPKGYGRIFTNTQGFVEAIIEDRDLEESQKTNTLCNSGVMMIDESFLEKGLAQLQPNNSQGEYYLTDLVKIATMEGLKCTVVEGNFEEFIGINTRKDLSLVTSILQNQFRDKAMAQGVTLVDPESVHFSFDTKLARDITIHPNVVIGSGVEIMEGAEIFPFCYLNDSTIGKHAKVGPFAHLRGQTTLEDKAEVGNFVELKKTHMRQGAKAKHLSYLGDATIGIKANVGAGTITCNYDGFSKFQTTIGDGAFVGTNCSLVAPIRIGDGAIVGAGSVITEDVSENDLAITRAEQRNIKEGASRFRNKNRLQKEQK